MNRRVLIRGGGEMGSGVAWRLRRCGFDVIITEVPHPMAVRRWVAFSEAVYNGSQTIEGIAARRASPREAEAVCASGEIPVIICPLPSDLGQFHPDVIVDAILAKRNTGLVRGIAPREIALGPGFTAGDDVDCVIETNRGPNLGRCIWKGSAEPNTGIPGVLAGESARRVLRAPVDGKMELLHQIGDLVKAHSPIARVGGVIIECQIDGIVRGLLRDGTPVTAGVKAGDIDPRGDPELCARISEKALAIAGGVLEGILTA